MGWLAVEKDGSEYIFAHRPSRIGRFWDDVVYANYVQFSTSIKLPKGTIKKLIGRELTWEDEPVELKEE